MAFIELQHSFDKTNFDLENGAPSGGPINASNYGHQHTYTPQNKFKDSPEGDKSTGVLKDKGFDGIESLDLENNGPKNVPLYNHNQNYTPTNKFKDSPEYSGVLETDGFSGNPAVPGTGFLDLENNGPNNEATYGHEQLYTPQDGQGYEDSPQGQIRSTDSAAEKNNFKTSALDLEDPLAGVNPPPGSNQGASGGPNRTNAIQSKNAFQSGQYTTTRAGGPGFGGNDVGGVVIKQTLHTYTPNNTYLDTIPIQTSANFTPKNNIAIEGEANGFDATIK